MSIDFDNYRGLPAAPMAAVVPFLQMARVVVTMNATDVVDLREGPAATPAPGLGWMSAHSRLLVAHFAVTEAPVVDVEPITLKIRVDDGLGAFYTLDDLPLYVGASSATANRIEGYVIPGGWNVLLQLSNQTTTTKTVIGMVQLRSVI